MRGRVATTACALCGVAVLLSSPATSQDADDGNQTDTQFIFGFTSGADVGRVGDREVENETFANFGVRQGYYRALSNDLHMEFVPVSNLRLELGMPVSYFDIHDVDGLDNRRRSGFNGVSSAIRWRLLGDDDAPFQLTINAEPQWNRFDENSGRRADGYSCDFALVIDKALIPNRLFTAFNLVYGAQAVHDPFAGIQRESTLGFLGSTAWQLRPGLFVGLEARYLQDYDGLHLHNRIGHATYVGPTIYVKLPGDFAISGAWSSKVYGPTLANSGDSPVFTHNQATLRFELDF